MVRFAWATDVHLDCLGQNDQAIVGFAESLVEQNPTGIFLTGDISVSSRLVYHLSALEKVVQRPIYYVLGNHDYWGSSVERVRKAMRELTNISSFLRYMPTMPYYAVSASTAVIGHDGWYDAYHGDWQASGFVMNDWYAIHDFLPLNANKSSIVAHSRKMAHEAVTHVHDSIKQAVKYYKRIVVLTHFPPFRESHVHNGKVGDDHAQPWFTNKMMGDMLLDASKSFPQHEFTVLAGHTHGKFSGRITPNLQVDVGAAEYSKPQLQGLVELP